MAETKVTSYELSGTIPVSRQNNTSNSTVPNARIETGWGVFTVSTSQPDYAETVTFGTPFTTAPIVVAVFGGDNTSTVEAYGNGQNIIEAQGVVKAHTVTVNGFDVKLRKPDNTNFGGNGRAYYQWIAIGS